MTREVVIMAQRDTIQRATATVTHSRMFDGRDEPSPRLAPDCRHRRHHRMKPRAVVGVQMQFKYSECHSYQLPVSVSTSASASVCDGARDASFNVQSRLRL
jgi:hypothetical protein